MNKKEWKIEVIVKGTPRLELVQENLMEAFVTGLIENLESCSEKAAHVSGNCRCAMKNHHRNLPPPENCL